MLWLQPSELDELEMLAAGATNVVLRAFVAEAIAEARRALDERATA